MSNHRPVILFLVSFLLFHNTGAQEVDMSIFHGLQPRNIGPAGMSGRVTAIDVVLNDPDVIYLGAAAGGVWKSENSGHTWTPIFEKEKAASIGAIAIYQKNPDIIYVGTGEGNPRNSMNSGYGMFKTIDGGRTWEHLGLEKTRQIHRVIVDPNNPDHVVIGVEGAAWGDSRHRGVYKTTDGGKTWKRKLYVDQRTGCADLVADPSNPNKMIAAMWGHRREPWFMTSGGPGSGIYISHNGGEDWEQVTAENGLPKGDLGRIGLAFAPSNPSIVYAYVESKSNGIFRSVDGGYNWKRMSKPDAPNIGGRPFYYADIYVDVKNENHIYSIATTVTESIDGGKTWTIFAPGNKIHTDHHAWWAHPNDPDFLMVGHDGGLNITHDRGKNWWFADNLPLAQFYHVSVDHEIPYNIYGGLQDNGSWKGPSQVFFKGGIRNFYWQRLSVGDGFDVVPDPLDHNFGYAMGQAGNLVRYDCESGQLLKIKPVHPDGEYLRFNWNAGIGINPFDKKTIYYGSQYLHKSSDQGQSWDIISPDLTTNNPEKQKWLETGGLTYDVTGAEFHTTIVSIAPSPLNEQVLWVGTDDGNVQVTRDGGTNWTNCRANIKGVPDGTWVPQIQVSKHREGEAFVVFDDHRRNNWEPFLFRTRDYGKTWERLVEARDVFGYVYCFEQDPVEPRLYFCGTEFGLYVSFDEGKNWNKWTNGFPAAVPVRDMVVHPRDHDLVLGTFGRAFWVLDDIRPLRAMAQAGVANTLEDDLQLFPTPDAFLRIIGESIGYRQGKVGDAYYNGTNRPYGALISYYLKNAPEEENKLPLKDQVKIEVVNSDGKTVRTIYQKPKKGVNRFAWDLRRDAPRYPNVAKPKKETAARGGLPVAPDNYLLKISYKDFKDQFTFSVLPDIRLEINEEGWAVKNKMIEDFYGEINKLTAALDEVRNLEQSIQFLKEKINQKEGTVKHEWNKKIMNFEKELKKQKEKVLPKKVQGIYRRPEVLANQLWNIGSYLGHTLSPPTENQKLALELFVKEVAVFINGFEDFKENKLAAFKSEVGDLGLNIMD
ncbi:MAG: hypothetical protein AAFZ15_15755 [Bacteroidota bacterium]